MKAISYPKISKSLVLLVILFSTSILFNACSKKIRFATSTVVPAAEGYVKIKKDDNKNYAITVVISNLADAKRLQPSRSVYVVWIDTKHNGLKNLGQLRSSSSFFSKGLEGTLNALTPFEPKRLFVTAEDKANVDEPGKQTVLTTRRF